MHIKSTYHVALWTADMISSVILIEFLSMRQQCFVAVYTHIACNFHLFFRDSFPIFVLYTFSITTKQFSVFFSDNYSTQQELMLIGFDGIKRIDRRTGECDIIFIDYIYIVCADYFGCHDVSILPLKWTLYTIK